MLNVHQVLRLQKVNNEIIPPLLNIEVCNVQYAPERKYSLRAIPDALKNNVFPASDIENKGWPVALIEPVNHISEHNG